MVEFWAERGIALIQSLLVDHEGKTYRVDIVTSQHGPSLMVNGRLMSFYTSWDIAAARSEAVPRPADGHQDVLQTGRVESEAARGQAVRAHDETDDAPAGGQEPEGAVMNRRELLRRAKETMHAALRRGDRARAALKAVKATKKVTKTTMLKAARAEVGAAKKALDNACDIYSFLQDESGPLGVTPLERWSAKAWAELDSRKGRS
jgi:hypothetical protein